MNYFLMIEFIWWIIVLQETVTARLEVGTITFRVSKSGKVICLGMDCLHAVNYLKKLKVKIDCFVALNEGLYEGGMDDMQSTAICFFGYVMPILSDEYIHIMNKKYYGNQLSCYNGSSLSND